MKRLFLLLLFLSSCGVEQIEVETKPKMNTYTYVVSGNCHRYENHIKLWFGTTWANGAPGVVGSVETDVKGFELMLNTYNTDCLTYGTWQRCEIKKNGVTVVSKYADYSKIQTYCTYTN